MDAVAGVAFGRNLYKLLAEDAFDHQPIRGAGGRYLLVADARIDNRDELLDTLRIDRAEAAVVSDAALLMRGWERWGVELHAHAIGDYALGAWDFEESSLTLLRSAFALKPLFYHVGPDFIAFASMPAGLHALEAIPKRLDIEQAAAIAGQFSYLGSSTIFKGIRQVRQGYAVRFRRGREDAFRLWEIERRAPLFDSLDEYGEALRGELDKAVAARLRRHHGKVASQLSAGRDSSAVTASAASLLAGRGEDLLALTGAPHAGFQGSPIPGALCDESDLAFVTASRSPNVRHVIVRPDAVSPIRKLETLNRLHHGPMINVSNLPWWFEVHQQACQRQAAIMLASSTGNFTISAGGFRHFGDLLREEGLSSWLRSSLLFGGSSPSRWRSLLNVTLSPRMPRSIHRQLLKIFRRWQVSAFEVPVLKAPYRSVAESRLREEWKDSRPPRSYFDFRREMLWNRDHPDKLSLALWGLDPRDPTSDRRVVELCFSVPAKFLVPGNSARPLYDAAFAGRVASEVLNCPDRGLQSADWFDHFRKEDVRAAFQSYRQSALVREFFDLDYLDGIIEAWPRSGWERWQVRYTYRNLVLGTLGLASFIHHHFPD